METFKLQKSNIESGASQFFSDYFRPLVLQNAFRILIAIIFCTLYLSKHLLPPFGSNDPELFFRASIAYLLFGLALGFLHTLHKLPFAIHVYASVLTDIIMVTILMHASGGIQSGLGVLLIVTIASGSIVVGGRSALGFAAIATIVLLLQQSYLSFRYPGSGNYPATGLLGLTYFISAIVFVFLARRIRESEALARRRGIDLANMAQLTEHIIQRMQTGVLVVDKDGSIRLINESAAQMLGVDPKSANKQLSKLVPELATQWQAWISNPDMSSELLNLTHSPIDIMPRFARIAESTDAGALIFLQDMASMAQQAQQLQLASLGRLTASIAHEIRNPLGAISHAGQLLAESENLDTHDQRLTRIISDHSQRLNSIIENIMSLSKRKSGEIELFNLHDFLQKFIADYSVGQNYEQDIIRTEISPENTQVRFDTGQLQQILVNLCDNGIRYGKDSQEKVKIILRGGLQEGATRPHLDIIDRGPGIDDEILANLFEPFFTTETSGTGLGLYLSRQLAEGNQAHLNYIKSEKDKGFFRITFQDPRRQFD